MADTHCRYCEAELVDADCPVCHYNPQAACDYLRTENERFSRLAREYLERGRIEAQRLRKERDQANAASENWRRDLQNLTTLINRAHNVLGDPDSGMRPIDERCAELLGENNRLRERRDELQHELSWAVEVVQADLMARLEEAEKCRDKAMGENVEVRRMADWSHYRPDKYALALRLLREARIEIERLRNVIREEIPELTAMVESHIAEENKVLRQLLREWRSLARPGGAGFGRLVIETGRILDKGQRRE